MPRNCYTCFHRAGEYACALIDLKTDPCRNFDRWKSARSLLTLKEAREIAGKDRERIEKSMKEEVMGHVCDAYCDCKTGEQANCLNCGYTGACHRLGADDSCYRWCPRWCTKPEEEVEQEKTPAEGAKTLGKFDVLVNNCSTCSYKACIRHGDKNYVCSVFKTKEDSVQKTCDTCTRRNKDEGQWCVTCTHNVSQVDHYEAVPALPEKYENLSWQEADKLWHEGWEVKRRGYVDCGYNFAAPSWEMEHIRATDWYVVGRRMK